MKKTNLPSVQKSSVIFLIVLAIGAMCITSNAANCEVDITIKSETVVQSPTDRKRQKLGVGEDVTLTLMPEEKATWTISGPGKIDGGTIPIEGKVSITFTAPDNAGLTGVTTQITAVCEGVGGKSATITFTTINPNGVFHVKRPDSTSATNPSLVLTTICDVYILPADVNFEKIKVKEDNCLAVANGYWSYKNELPHFEPPFRLEPKPVGMSGHVDDKGTKVDGTDTVQSVTRGGPYYEGAFHWLIPWRYGINQKDQGIFVESVDMRSQLNLTTLSHQKGGMSDSVSIP